MADVLTFSFRSLIKLKSFGGGSIEHLEAISLKFKNGTDLKQVREIIERNKGKAGVADNPQHYFIQLVDLTQSYFLPVSITACRVH